MTTANLYPLLGVAVVVVGFGLRFNPVLVVVIAGLASSFAAGLGVDDMLALLGSAFVGNRALLLFVLTLPTIGLLEHFGLRERASIWIASFRGLTFARFQIAYLGIRQISSMMGLTHVAGHAQTVRPLVAPMSIAAAERSIGKLDEEASEKVRACAAATDNIGLFFGEDVFVAIGAVLLIQGFYASNGIVLEPLHIALWALPTAIAAFIIHAIRINLLQSSLRKQLAQRIQQREDDAQA